MLLRRQAPCDQQNEEMQQRADGKAIAYRAEVETRVVRTVEVSVRPDGRQQQGYAPSLTDLEPDWSGAKRYCQERLPWLIEVVGGHVQLTYFLDGDDPPTGGQDFPDRGGGSHPPG